MKNLTIFGKEYSITTRKSAKGTIQLKKNQIIISPNCQQEKTIKQVLAELLCNKLEEITEHIKKEGKIDLLGNLEFEVVEKIDNREDRLAKIKGNKVIVRYDAVTLPEDVLKYIIAHELAHVANKKHTKKFWKTVKLMYPDFQEAKKQLSMFHMKQ